VAQLELTKLIDVALATYIEDLATELAGVVKPIRVFTDPLALLGERGIFPEVSFSVFLHVHICLECPVANCNHQGKC